jgi:CubicO group peptidase (beta-lactamase class C family)/peptidoglycan/LPS O-acetylase OafA/YrhL
MGAQGTERERFLDAVRTLAVLRVIVWHAFGAAVITYVVSAVPAMFFVTGSLLARSIDRHGGARTILDRLRRMLIPLWAFTAVAFTVMAVADRITPSDATAVPRDALGYWLFPVTDPKGSAWEAGWLSSPLWYLRALLWIVLAAPLLLRVVRRAPWPTFALLVGAVFALDIAARHPQWPLQQTRAPWLVGDFALYAIFVSLGFLHRDGRLAQLTRRTWAFAAVAACAAATAWVITQPVHNEVVNDSHPAHLLVGFAWLALSLSAAPLIEAVARRRHVANFITAMNSRSMTVYLWHSTAIIVGYQLLWRLPFTLPYGVFSASLLALTAVGTITLVTAFGWIEDLAAKRQGALWPTLLAQHPRRSGSIALAGMSIFALVGLGSVTFAPLSAAQAASVSKVPAPSQQPPTPVATTAASSLPASAVAEAAKVQASGSADVGAALTSVVATWLKTAGVEGAQVAVMKDGQLVWADAVGTTAAGKALSVSDTFDIWSITKTYTAWMIYQLVQSGQIDLDAPLPKITALPSLDTTGLTVQRLLDHSSGLMPYRDTAEYLANPNSIDDPISAMNAVIAEPRVFEAGSKHVYSSTNYLVLGLLLEQITGQKFDTLLTSEILKPYSLTSITHIGGTPGNPNFSTGGLLTNIVDLVTWAQLYLADHAGISDANYALMNAVDSSSGVGTGTIGYCPCIPNATGQNDFAAIGFGGSTSEIEYAATDHITIAINLTQSIWDPGNRYQDVVDLFGALRTVVDARSIEG